MSKWAAVAAAAEKEESEAIAAAGSKWKDKLDASNSNLIPIGDWRAKVRANASATNDESG